MSNDRNVFDEAVANMSIASTPFYKEYVFYMHVLSQCRVIFDDTLKAPTGVNFTNGAYNLYINLGVYKLFPLEQRIGVIKHEMLHIALGHILRVKDENTNHVKFNYAADCALNQEIDRDHLPKGVIYPDNYPAPEANNHWKQTSEFYYNLLENTPEEELGAKEPGPSSATGKGALLDDHDLWQESEGDEYVQTEITKKMVEKAANDTVKSMGSLPSNYSGMVENLTIRREVNWKQVLRRIVGNKKANTRKTLMRRDRRLPFANWIKGKTKDRIFELAVVSDVSGSVSESALKELWGEIINICHTYNTPVQMVQVDTTPTAPEALSKKSKVVERKAMGGTFLSPAIDSFKEYKVSYNAIVVTTDGYLSTEDVMAFYALKVPVIWLVESTGKIMEDMNQGKMTAIKLTN